MRTVVIVSLVLFVACAPKLGDGCSTSLNCSVNGDRLCDPTQPGGACIIYECEADRCPDNAVCARFRPVPRRAAVTACVKRCEVDGDCRTGEGYRCIDPQTYENGQFASVVDVSRATAKFCVYMNQ